jgi:Domain of unknown function (DUF4157)
MVPSRRSSTRDARSAPLDHDPARGPATKNHSRPAAQPAPTRPSHVPVRPAADQSAGPDLIVVERDDPREHEADRLAALVLPAPRGPESPPEVGRGGARPGPASAPRTARWDDAGEGGRRRGPPGGRRAPPAVKAALAGPARGLDTSSRAFFEPRFGLDLGHVRVRDDAEAAGSARAIGARAYTVGGRIAFADGQYRPHTESGRALLAHELAHVVRSGTDGSTVLRDEDPAEAQRVATLRQDLADAIKYGHWGEAAFHLGAFNAGDIQEILSHLPSWQKAAIYEGAMYREGVGPDSAAALATRPFYLDREIGKAINGSQWGWAAHYLNGFNESDLRQRLTKFETPTVQAIHDAAQTTPAVGPQSTASLITADVLEQRRNAPAPPVDRAGQLLYDALAQGIESSSPDALKAAEDLANTFYKVEYGPGGSRHVSWSQSDISAAAKRVGIFPETMDKIVRLVRPFAPTDKPLYIDYAGRVGTKEDLARRELAERLEVIAHPGSTFGSLLASYVAVRGGTAADMRAAADLGTALEGLASAMPVTGAASAPPAPTEPESRTGSEIAPRVGAEAAPPEGTPTAPTREPPAAAGEPPSGAGEPPSGAGQPPGGGAGRRPGQARRRAPQVDRRARRPRRLRPSVKRPHVGPFRNRFRVEGAEAVPRRRGRWQSGRTSREARPARSGNQSRRQIRRACRTSQPEART